MATNILMPALSPTMTMGTLARWVKQEGDSVAPGDVLAEIETDKATMEMEAVEEGILGRILVPEGTSDVAVNAPIAILVEEGEEVPAGPVAAERPADPPLQTPDAAAQKSAACEESSAPGAAETKPVPPARPPERKDGQSAEEKKGKRIFVSPLARRVAKELGVALSSLTGTGPNGRILRRDVKPGGKVAEEAPAAGQVRHVPHSGMRKVIARRLTESKTQIPHFYVSIDLEIDALLALRAALNASVEDKASRISVNDMMIRAAALAHRKVEGLNVQFTATEMLHFEDIDIAMAVSVPDGLVTPIIRQADRKSLKQISAEARDLAQRARAGKLKPEEFQGGTFSISNMGMFGVKDFAAIVNPPQAAILAIAAGEQRPVVRDRQVAIATVMTVTLSVDHRAVDGALGARWLNALRDLVQNPYSLVI